MTTQELIRKQLDYIAKLGGYWELLEADGVNNDLNREIIAAFRSEHDKAFIGFINLPDEKLEVLRTGQEVSVYEEYVGQHIYNFGCSFIVPEADKELELLIKQWNSKGTDSKNADLMNKIFNRIKQLGGLNFIWS